MESTSVYWIPIFELLVHVGSQCFLSTPAMELSPIFGDGLIGQAADGHAGPIESGEIMSRRPRRNHAPGFLKGISTGDFSEALAALLGRGAPGLSPTAIVRLKDGWIDEHDAWQKRDLSAKATSTSGQTASICKPGLKTRSGGFWC